MMKIQYHYSVERKRWGGRERRYRKIKNITHMCQVKFSEFAYGVVEICIVLAALGCEIVTVEKIKY